MELSDTKMEFSMDLIDYNNNSELSDLEDDDDLIDLNIDSSFEIEDKEFLNESEKRDFIMGELNKITNRYLRDMNDLISHLKEIEDYNEKELKIIESLFHHKKKKRKRDWSNKLEFSKFDEKQDPPDFHEQLLYMKKLKKKPRSSKIITEDNENSDSDKDDSELSFEFNSVSDEQSRNNFANLFNHDDVQSENFYSVEEYVKKKIKKQSPQKIDWIEESKKANQILKGKFRLTAVNIYQTYMNLHNMWAVNSTWSKNDEDKLNEAVKRHGTKNWKVVASLIDGKSTSNCSQHWNKTIKKSVNHKPWDTIDDVKLALGKELYGEKWNKIAELFDNRTDIQVRERWCNVLNPDIKSDKWSKQDENKLKELARSYNFKWGKIAKKIGNRTDNQCLRKWKNLTKIKSRNRVKKEKNFILKCFENKKDIFKVTKFKPVFPNLKMIRKTSSSKYNNNSKTLKKTTQNLNFVSIEAHE